jgi:hypothetical protein
MFRDASRPTRPGRILQVCAPIVVASCWAGCALAATAPSIEDPVFDIGYSAATVHFGSVSTNELLPACKRNLSEFRPLPRQLILYAKYDGTGSRLYIAAPPGAIGIYVIRGSRCDSGVAQLALLQRKGDSISPRLTDDEIKGLFLDALKRYSRAFGGKAQFLDWLDSTNRLFKERCRDPVYKCEPYYSESGLMTRVLNDFRSRG